MSKPPVTSKPPVDPREAYRKFPLGTYMNPYHVPLGSHGRVDLGGGMAVTLYGQGGRLHVNIPAGVVVTLESEGLHTQVPEAAT